MWHIWFYENLSKSIFLACPADFRNGRIRSRHRQLPFAEGAAAGTTAASGNDRASLKFGPRLAPFAKLTHHGLQGLTVTRQLVFHARRVFWKNVADDNAIAFEFAELLRQHFLRGVRQQLAQFAVTPLPGHEVVKDDGLPFTANDINRGADGTIFKAHGLGAVFKALFCA